MINRIKIWIKAVRAPFFTATIVPVVLGAVIAWSQLHRFNWFYFLIALAGGLFIHAGLDLANDYFDHTSGVDEKNTTPTPFSGGSRMIQEKILSPGSVLKSSILFFLAGIIIGIYLNFVLPGNILLLIGVIGVFLAFFYTAPPFRIGYTEFGLLACAAGFGPIMVLGSYYVQTGSLDWMPFFASIPVGILITLVLYINEFPDYEADKQAGKKTLVVILGKRNAILVYYLLLVSVYLCIIFGVLTGIFPRVSFITFITLPLSIRAVRVAKQNYDKIQELLPANAATIGLHLTIGLLLSISYILECFVK